MALSKSRIGSTIDRAITGSRNEWRALIAQTTERLELKTTLLTRGFRTEIVRHFLMQKNLFGTDKTTDDRSLFDRSYNPDGLAMI